MAASFAAMKRTLLVAAAAAGALSACAPMYGPPPPPPPPMGGPGPSGAEFRAQDFAWSTIPGRGRVDGVVGYAQGPVRYTCESQGVILTPETPWTRRRMTILYGSAERAALPADVVRARTPSAPSGDYSAFIKRGRCDAGGRFLFEGLPPGPWFAVLVARPVGGGRGEDVALMRRVVVREGRTAVVTLN